MEQEKLSRYFERLGLELPAEIRADGALLRRIFRAHVTHVPYENIDYLNLEKKEITPERLYEQVVVKRRGGTCYDLNGLLGEALRTLGYAAYPVIADHYRTHMEHTNYRHSALVVRDCEGTVWLCDVGDSFSGALEPLLLQEGAEQRRGGEVYRLEKREDGEWMLSVCLKGEWIPNYAFREEPATWEDLTYYKLVAMNPEIPFTQEELFHLRAEDGFRMLRGRTLVEKTAEGKTVRTVEESELPAVYALFGLRHPRTVYMETE